MTRIFFPGSTKAGPALTLMSLLRFSLLLFILWCKSVKVSFLRPYKTGLLKLLTFLLIVLIFNSYFELAHIPLKSKRLAIGLTHFVFKSVHLVWKVCESTLVLLILVFKFKLVLEVKKKKEQHWDTVLLKSVNDDKEMQFMRRPVNWGVLGADHL